MLQVQLPDGKVLDFDSPTTGRDVAAKIGPGLAKAAVAVVVDNSTLGLDSPLPGSGKVELRILTRKDPEALGVMRHSCAHVMARAVMRLYEDVELAFGPTLENGYYYDIGLPVSITEEDFPRIEAEMAKIIKQDEEFERIEESREKSLALCSDLNQPLKVEHIQEGLADHETLSFYRQGEFIDLCRGPHVPSAGYIGAFKLLSVAGAYWKGDQSNQQLQRLYGTAFFNKEDLAAYLERVEEAKRRDHRTLGKQQQLFTTTPLVGSGLILWEPKGALIRGILEGFVREELIRRGYSPVYSPHIGRVEMYETSGHFPYYRESQFPPIFDHDAGALVDRWLERLKEDKLDGDGEQALLEAARVLGMDEETAAAYPNQKSAEERIQLLQQWQSANSERFLLKPMNCPHHAMIYKAHPRSYRDLPLRLAEFGTVYRYEKSGELGGMTRVRGFTQDDAHLFCTADQVAEEFRGCIEMTQFVLKCVGMDDYRVRLGFRDPQSDKYVGTDEGWSRAESSLEEVCRDMELPNLEIEQGEAAFYGPKADFVVTDCIGREWQLGTVQLDYNLPSQQRFALEYTGADNHAHQPVMIHRAPLGSMERFIGVLIEHFGGAFPLWLAPEQARVLVVSQKFEDYGRQVEEKFRAAGLRVTGDYRPEKLGAKIRDAQMELIPYMLVVGGRDLENGTVSLRDRIDGDQGALPIASAIQQLQQEVGERRVRQKFTGGDAGLVSRAEAHEY